MAGHGKCCGRRRFGGSITRQITGVAAGSDDTDAVNVAQLKDAIRNSAGEIPDFDGEIQATAA